MEGDVSEFKLKIRIYERNGRRNGRNGRNLENNREKMVNGN